MKNKSEVSPYGKPAFYAVLYDSMKKSALELGYTLAIHGSLHSDMDLIAVAWTEDAKSVDELIQSIDDCLGKTIFKNHNWATCKEKPHGRICIALHIM